MNHGKMSTYTNHKCRCEACRQAMRTYQESYRERIAQKNAAATGFSDEPFVTQLAPHGQVSTYVNWKCRCDECRQAHTDYKRDLARRHREGEPVRFQHGTIGGYTNHGCRCYLCVRVYQMMVEGD